MENKRFKVGDRVRIKSLDWYNENKDKDGIVELSTHVFVPGMSQFCGKIMTIEDVFEDIEDNAIYYMKEIDYDWTDEMIEGFVEEETEKKLSDESWKPSKEEMDVLYGLAYITNQYDEHKEEIITRLYQDLKREFFNGSTYENMFPDTEDDVRRRSTIQILEYTRSLDNYNQYGKEDIDKNIAWLEKQGKKPQGKSALEVINEKNIDNQNCVKPTDRVESKFKVGDKIRLKSTLLNDIFGVIGYESEGYRITNISNGLTYFMSYSIEHYYELVEEETKPNIIEEAKTYWDSIKDAWICPEGYIFKDENGNVINATKIVLEKKNDKKEKFLRELSDLLNKYNIDSKMDMPDYVLAEYIWRTLFVNE